MRLACHAIATVLLSAALAAQCPFQQSAVIDVGPGCNSGPTGCCLMMAAPSMCAGTLDVPTCEVRFHIDALEGCCGVTAPIKILALGVTPAMVPIPELGRDCALFVDPLVTMFTTGSMFVLPVPPGPLSPISIIAQGVVLHAFQGNDAGLTLTNAIALGLS